MSSDQTNASDETVSVHHVPERHRYEIEVDGRRAGVAVYTGLGSRRVFFHTEIDDEFGGRGLAGRLVGHALADTRAAGLRIVAVCPYVAKWMSTHDGFDDVRDPITPAALAAVGEASQ